MPLNWFDRTVAAVSPAAGLRRAAARLRLDTLRAYEAGRVSARDRLWRAADTGPNAEVGTALGRMRARSRQLVRDNPYAQRMVTVLANHQVGYGITPRSNTGSKALDKRVDALWNEWAAVAELSGTMGFAGALMQAARCRSEAGEALVRLVRPDAKTAKALGLPVPLQVEVLEPDLLAETLDGARLPGKPQIVQGVEFAAGRRVAYWLRDGHPGEGGTSSLDTAQRWAASEVFHLFRAHGQRPGQVRGVPDLAPVLVRARRLDDFEDATLERAKVEAMLGIVFEVTEGDGGFGGSVPGGAQAVPGTGAAPAEAPQIELYPGMVVTAPPGSKPHFIQGSGAGAFEPYALHHLRAMAAGAGVTYEQTTGDLRQTNYSSGRLGRIEFKKLVEQDQWLMLIPQVCDRLWSAWIGTAILAGKLDARAGGYPVAWMPPRIEMVDPSQDIPTLRSMRRMGLQTWRQQVAEQGYNPGDQLDELEAENGDFDERGLILDGDPRRVALAGTAQDPKQLAAVEIGATGAAIPRQEGGGSAPATQEASAVVPFPRRA